MKNCNEEKRKKTIQKHVSNLKRKKPEKKKEAKIDWDELMEMEIHSKSITGFSPILLISLLSLLEVALLPKSHNSSG